MVYKFADGYPRRDMDADAVGQALDGLNSKHGKLTADIVVKAAKPKASPMHNAFEWNDKAAAEKYRLRQAGNLIRAVVIVDDDGEEPVVRQFVNVTIADGDGEASRHYMSIQAAMADEETRMQVLADAKSELEAFKRKYAKLRELARVIIAIDEVV